MQKPRYAVLALSLVVACSGIAVAQAGMMGGQMPMGLAAKAEEPKPGEPPGQMPMTPELAARMMNACIGAMAGMAQMGWMMGGHGGATQTPSEHKP